MTQVDDVTRSSQSEGKVVYLPKSAQEIGLKLYHVDREKPVSYVSNKAIHTGLKGARLCSPLRTKITLLTSLRKPS